MSPLFGKNKENTTENTAPQTGEEQTGTEQHHGGHRPPMPPQGFQGGQMPQGFPGQLNADAEGQELTQEQLQNAMQGWTEGQRPPMPPQGFQGGQMPQGFPGQQTANGEAAQAEIPLFLYEEEHDLGLKAALEARPEAKTVSLFSGPEGGFDPAEAELAVERGMRSVTLGKRILRCETAPLAALTAVMFHTGEL